jgi:hypothetical protein
MTMGKIAKAFLVLLVAAAIAWAGDPWKGKPYKTWDKGDAMKVLNESPWASVTRVRASWKPAELAPEMPGGGGTMGGAGGGSPNTMHAGGGQMGGGGGGGMAAPGGGMAPPGGVMTTVPETIFEVRWLSSRVMREGLVRLQELNGTIQEAQAESYLAQVPSNYQLWLLGPDMTPFENLEEKALQAGAHLELKKTHERIPPSSVQIERDQKGKVTGLIYSFPKTLANGEPVIPAKEQRAEFVCQAGPKTTLRFTFDLRKMVDPKGKDL